MPATLCLLSGGHNLWTSTQPGEIIHQEFKWVVMCFPLLEAHGLLKPAICFWGFWPLSWASSPQNCLFSVFRSPGLWLTFATFNVAEVWVHDCNINHCILIPLPPRPQHKSQPASLSNQLPGKTCHPPKGHHTSQPHEQPLSRCASLIPQSYTVETSHWHHVGHQDGRGSAWIWCLSLTFLPYYLHAPTNKT